MKSASITTVILVLCISAFAQGDKDALAAVGGRTFTAQDLEPNIADAWNALPERLRESRVELLEQQIDGRILELEAAKRETTAEKLVEAEVFGKLKEPSEGEIRKVYAENREQIGGVPLERIRAEIITFLKREAERKAYSEWMSSLRKNYDISYGKDINSGSLTGSDIIATIGDKVILYIEYQRKNGLTLYELEANTVDAVLRSLTQVVDAAVYSTEAESLGIATSQLIAQEVTDKMKEYSDEEREQLEGGLRSRLYKKYRVIFFVKEPAPFVQPVSADDDPFIGRSDAKVTVVMFTDFQCPGCAGVHPILKSIVMEFGNSVRLVVRDFPLTSIHENAFNAAVAAGAAEKQGKYFEFADLLYNNQDSLDSESLSRFADQAGLNLSRFERDRKNPQLAAEVEKDIADGKNYGVSGTPSVFVNGYKVRTLSASSFKKAINRALGN